jgi:hypothetical protein
MKSGFGSVVSGITCKANTASGKRQVRALKTSELYQKPGLLERQVSEKKIRALKQHVSLCTNAATFVRRCQPQGLIPRLFEAVFAVGYALCYGFVSAHRTPVRAYTRKAGVPQGMFNRAQLASSCARLKPASLPSVEG